MRSAAVARCALALALVAAVRGGGGGADLGHCDRPPTGSEGGHSCAETDSLLHEPQHHVTVFTVATESNHGLERYLRSAKTYGIDVKVLGMGEEWSGGDMNFAGGGQKINLLKKVINSMHDAGANKDQIILFTDSYDVMFLSGVDEMVRKFQAVPNTRVLFSAESFCWPDAGLASQYPNTKATAPYLNSGGFIGYLPELYEILNLKPVKDKDDDQLYYTTIFLDKDLRESLKISLDHDSVLFQNLNGAYSDVLLQRNISLEWPYIENQISKSKPSIVHGNGPTKVVLNTLGNYLAQSWSAKHGCQLCKEKRRNIDEKDLPEVMLAIFIEQGTPFIEDFFATIIGLDYPKTKLHLFVRNNVEYHEAHVEQFVKSNGKEYASVKRIKPSDFMSEAEARNIAKERCTNTACEYMFAVDSVARLFPNALRYLVNSGYDVIAPLLVRPGQMWSNFWGALNNAGFYARSADYMDIVNSNILGIWNVPFISHCYLVKMSTLKELPSGAITFEKDELDADMAFCTSLRNAGVFMFVSNEQALGHLVNPEDFDSARTHPDVYELFNNRYEWERRYLHPNYSINFEDGRKHLMPCPDVYWFPLMSMRFCKEWIDIMEAYGRWSDGSNSDKRLEGGYEAVPTRDIHMTQVGLDKHWLHILKEYVRPLQESVFLGYFHNPPVSIMNFVVRYRPDEQPSLRPHHDSSTYTINLALNTPLVDYEGGGCSFLRYNCSVRDTKPGWLLMHPGRLTHYHEGLLVTRGTRYIMISFVDP